MNEMKILGRTQMCMDLGVQRRKSAKQHAQDVALKGWQPAAEIPTNTTNLSRQQRRATERRQFKEQMK